MNSLNNTKSETNKKICNGLGCLCAATNYIDEEVGDIGKISLQLCDDCLAKFREC
jgi:hypothetical protein